MTPGASHDDEQPPTTASASESGTTAGRDNLQSAGRDLVGRAQIHYQAPRSVADPVFLGAYGAGLTRCLRAAGVTVVEINQPHPHTRSRRGKTDAVDAEAAARKVIFREATMTLKDTTGVVEAIRQLQVARHSAVKARSAELCQLGQLLTTAPAAVRETVTAQRKTLEGQATVCARLRPDMTRLDDPVHAARFALGGVAQRIVALRREIAGYDTHLDALVADVAPTTSALLGVGTHHTAQLLVTAGLNIDRLHSDGAFAHVCGADPIPASSGKTIRHRLNPGGDRDANRALHMIAVVRLRYCKRTRAYAERRRAEGKTNKETCAASSATSPDRSTAPSSPTSAHNGHV